VIGGVGAAIFITAVAVNQFTSFKFRNLFRSPSLSDEEAKSYLRKAKKMTEDMDK
jgi:hypothetical protein